MIRPLPRDWVAHGSMLEADFDEKTLTFKIDGDMPLVAAGRFSIIPADTLLSLTLRLRQYETKAK